MSTPATPNAATQVLEPLTNRRAWKALQAHYEKIRGLHLRKLFADDVNRGERMTAEAAEHLPRLFQKSHHERNRQFARTARRGVGSAAAHRCDVSRG